MISLPPVETTPMPSVPPPQQASVISPEPTSLAQEAAMPKATETPKTSSRPMLTLLAPVLLGVIIVGMSQLAMWADTDQPDLSATLKEHCRFHENEWQERKAYHTFVTHAVLHDNREVLAYSLVGLLWFGWLVARNIGFWRTLFVFAFSAMMSVGVWRFILTPFGEKVVVDVVNRVFDFLIQRFDLEIVLMCLRFYQELCAGIVNFRGPVYGAAGGVAGLMAFALCRQTHYTANAGSRWLTILGISIYVSFGAFYVWPTIVMAAFPTILWIGGAVGGWIACVPDKAFSELQPSFRRASSNSNQTK